MKKPLKQTLFTEEGDRLFFDENDRAAFIKAADGAKETTKTFCHVLHYTGCSFSEAMGLNFNRIDCANAKIVFADSRAARAVPVPDALIELLDTVHDVRGIQESDQANQQIWSLTRKALFNRVIQVIADAGIADGPHAMPKGIRQGFLVHAISRRILVTRLQQWMGHADCAYTAEYVAELMQHNPELFESARADAERIW